MKTIVPVLALALASALPLAASAQSGAPANGPSPEMRARMTQARDAAKTAAYADLSTDHRAQVQAIVDAVTSGKQTDLRAAAQQIDAVLSPAERTAVLRERDTMRQRMFADMPSRPPSDERPAGARDAQSGTAANGQQRAEAGRFVLSVSLTREQMRALREQQQQQQQ